MNVLISRLSTLHF